MNRHCITLSRKFRGLFAPGKEKAMKVFWVVALVLFALGVGLAQAQPQPVGADTAKAYKLCPKCHTANPAQARFCFSCGAALEAGTVSAAPSGVIYADSTHCPKCGAERLPQAQFCSNCGASFADLSSAGPPRKLESGPKKEPVMAFAFSFLIPGAGQCYNGQAAKGAIFFGGYLTGWGLLAKGFAESFSSDNSGNGPAGIGLVLMGGSWIISMIDAQASARDINHRRGYSALTSPGVGLVFVPDPRNSRRFQPGVGLRAGF